MSVLLAKQEHIPLAVGEGVLDARVTMSKNNSVYHSAHMDR